MSLCSDTLNDTLNARNHLPGTTILVPSDQFFTHYMHLDWQLNSNENHLFGTYHQSGKSSMFPSKRIKFTKSLTKGINSEF